MLLQEPVHGLLPADSVSVFGHNAACLVLFVCAGEIWPTQNHIEIQAEDINVWVIFDLQIDVFHIFK